MINDGNAFPAPPGLIAGIKVGANSGFPRRSVVEGVNHSEMGNNLEVRDAIKDILDGKYDRDKHIFWIKRRN